MKPHVGHIRTFGCIVKVTLLLGKLEDRAVMGYLLGYKYDGGYRVWIPKMGVRESRDITFYEGMAPMVPDHGSAVEVRREEVQGAGAPRLTPPNLLPVPTTTPAPAPVPEPVSNETDEAPSPQGRPERLTIRVPSRYHPRAPRPQDTIEDDTSEGPIPTNLRGPTVCWTYPTVSSAHYSLRPRAQSRRRGRINRFCHIRGP
jgi:hypothetical protein